MLSGHPAALRMPPMPISAYRNLSDEDLGAIFAYLRTVPAVKNSVPEPMAPRSLASPGPFGSRAFAR